MNRPAAGHARGMRATRFGLHLLSVASSVAIVVACSAYGEGSGETKTPDAGDEPPPPPPTGSITPPPPPSGDSGPTGEACPPCPASATCVAAGCTGHEQAVCDAPKMVDAPTTFTVTVCADAPKATLEALGPCEPGALPAASFRLGSGPAWTIQVLDLTDSFFTLDSCANPNACAHGTGAAPPFELPPVSNTFNIGPLDPPTGCTTFRVVFGDAN